MLAGHMFQDAISKLSLRKKLIILASIGVILPLLGLTYLQYRSLSELRNTTKGAFKDNLRQGLTIVEAQMKQRLEDVASQTLEPIGGINLSSAEELEKYLAKTKLSHPEIEQIFVFKYSDGTHETNKYGYFGVALIIKAIDREARLAQAKSNFVANVSHELKTPLSLLSLFSEILELGRVKNEEKRVRIQREDIT